MPRKADPLISRVCLTVNTEDYHRLQELYNRAGVSAVVRALMRAHLRKIDRIKERDAEVEPIDIIIPEESMNV